MTNKNILRFNSKLNKMDIIDDRQIVEITGM